MASFFRDTGIRQSFNCINGIIRFNFDIPIHTHIPINLMLTSWHLGTGNNIIIDGEFSEIKALIQSQKTQQPLHPHFLHTRYCPSEQTPDQQTKHPLQLR